MEDVGRYAGPSPAGPRADLGQSLEGVAPAEYPSHAFGPPGRGAAGERDESVRRGDQSDGPRQADAAQDEAGAAGTA